MNWKTILLIFVIGVSVQCQGGGGGGRGGRSGSRSSSKKKPFIMPLSRCTQKQCPKLRSQCDKQCVSNYKDDNDGYYGCVEACKKYYGNQTETDWRIIAGFVAGIFGIGYFLSNQNEKEGQKFVQQHIKNIKNVEYSKDEINSKFQYIKNLKQSIIFHQTTNRYQTSILTISGQQAKQKYLYTIKIQGSDYFGTWYGNGFISFCSVGTLIYFSKIYNNRKKAGQTGKWKNLVYEGKFQKSQNGDAFSGNWFYQGFKTDYRYSGTWQTEVPKLE